MADSDSSQHDQTGIEILRSKPRAEVLEMMELFKQVSDCGAGALYGAAETCLVQSVLEKRRLPFDTNGIDPFIVEAMILANTLNDEWLLKLKKRASEIVKKYPCLPKISAVVINIGDRKGGKATTA